jgi:hypothetical protein
MRDKQRFFLDLEAETLAGWRANSGISAIAGSSPPTTTGARPPPICRAAAAVVARHGYFDEVLSYEPGQTITSAARSTTRQAMCAASRPRAGSENPSWSPNTGIRSGTVFGAKPGSCSRLRGAQGGISCAAMRLARSIFASAKARRTSASSRPTGWDSTPWRAPARPCRRSSSIAATSRRPGASRPIPLAGTGDLIDDGQGDWPADLTTIGLMMGLGLTAQPFVETTAAEAIVIDRARGEPRSRPARALSKLRDAVTGAPGAGLASRIAMLRECQDPAGREPLRCETAYFQSDTGELLLDAPRRWMQAVTPLTEAASFERLDTPQRLGVMTLQGATGPALVSVSALDGEPIARSRRLLLISATDAQNTDMRSATASAARSRRSAGCRC